MKRTVEIHAGHTEVISEVNFLKQEISFLLTLLRKAYSAGPTTEEIKLLDAYWKEFEKCSNDLEGLLTKVQYEEEQLGTKYSNGITCVFSENEECQCTFKKIYNETRAIKESFYEFIKRSTNISKHVLA